MVNSSLPHRACEYTRIRKRRERVRSLRFLAWRKICFHMASFGHLLVQIWTDPLSNPEAPPQSYGRFASIRLHFDTFLSKSDSNLFRTQKHLPKAMADLLPYGFIWTLSRPDLNRTTFEPRSTSPKLWQICFHMASFWHLLVQIWFEPFSNPEALPQNYNRFASIWLRLDTFLSRSGSSNSRIHVHIPKAKRIWIDRLRARAHLST